MAIEERLRKITQKRLGYTDEELEIFRQDPRNEDILTQGAALMNKTIIFKRTNCFDVGLQCGGWGHVILALSVEDRPES